MALLVLLTLPLLGQTVTAQECITDEIRTVRDNGRDFIQYCVRGEWRLHCTGESVWRFKEATVACRQLGYAGAVQRITPGGPRAGNPGVALTSGFFRFAGQCSGNESSVRECGGDVEELDSCSPSHGTAATCQPACSNEEIRLVSGSTIREGRVEVCVNGRWGTVCSNQEGIAETVCAYLGFPDEGAETRGFTERTAPGMNCVIQSEADPLQCTTGSCDLSPSLEVVCNTFQDIAPLVINRTISATLQSLNNMGQPAQQSNSGAVIALGIIVALLVFLLVVAIIGWIITGLKLSRSGPSKDDKSSIAGVHFTPTETTIPCNNSVEEKRLPKLTTQAKPAHLTPVGGSKKGDYFHNTEEHTYAMIDKEAKKKAKNNDKTEDDSHVYDTTMHGETLWGVQANGEEYSKLQH